MPRRPVKQPIPRHAKRVFRGVVFDIYQWKQKLFDGTFATFESLRRRDSVTVVAVTPENKILVTSERQPGKHPFVGVPGGVIDDGETPRKAARRELLEETGYSPKALIPWFSYQPAGRVDWVVHLFIARGCTKVASPRLDGGERIIVRPVSFSAFVQFMRMNRQVRNQDIVMQVLRASLDPRKMRKLKRTILGK